MRRNLYKLLFTLSIVFLLSGCISHFTLPLTAGPLLVTGVGIYRAAGVVSEGTIDLWWVLSGLTYLQTVAVLGQFATIVFMKPLQDGAKGRPFQWPFSTWTMMGGTAVYLVLLGIITGLFFPVWRGDGWYTELWLQWLPTGAVLIWGLFTWTMTFSRAAMQRRHVRRYRKEPQRRGDFPWLLLGRSVPHRTPKPEGSPRRDGRLPFPQNRDVQIPFKKSRFGSSRFAPAPDDEQEDG